MKISIFLLFMCLFVSANLQAQEESPELTKINPGKYAIGINSGLPGVGIDFARKINAHFMLRLQGNYLKYALNDFEANVDGTNVLINANVDFFNSDLLLDIHPFKSSSFKFVLGAGYFFNQEISTSMKFNDEMYINDILFTADEVGTIGISNHWEPIVAYGGIGFGRAVPNRRIGFGIDLGTYYLGEPTPVITATGMLEDTKNQEQQLADDLNEYRWLPVFKFRISIKL